MDGSAFADYPHGRGLYYGSYKAPRELLWIIGCLIYLVMMATGFIGYVLPWGQMSFWGATVITGFFGAVPVVGESLQQWLLGGYAVDNATLTRFFALHYLLPFVIAGLVGLHVWALHHVGQNNPIGITPKTKEDTLSFHPFYTVKDGFALCVFFLIFAFFIFYQPDALGHADNYIRADAMKTPPHIVPEWYFLPFYAILRARDLNRLQKPFSADIVAQPRPLNRKEIMAFSKTLKAVLIGAVSLTGLTLGSTTIASAAGGYESKFTAKFALAVMP